MTPTPALIDPRGPRFGAAVTSVLLALAIIGGTAWGIIPLIITLAAFALGSILGLQAQPWGLIFRTLIRPRIDPPTALEDPRPPRFAQSVGLGFAVVAAFGWLIHVPALFYIATGFALLAALLNAVFDFCLGCEVWALWQRARHRVRIPRRVPAG